MTRSLDYFHDQVEPGAKLSVRAPRGEFWLDPRDDTPLVLLSGGVGLTPMISMLNAIVAAGSTRPFWFIHGTRHGGEHAMGAHVRRRAAEHDNVHVDVRYSQPRPEDIAGRDYDGPGRVGIELLKRLLPPAAYDFYLCGPTPFMRALYNGLLEWGVPEARIHHEFFGTTSVPKAGAVPPARRAESAAATRAPEVVFQRSQVAAKWDPAAGSILELAEAQGLRPDSSCRSGICHTCMCTLIDGEVEYVVQPVDLPDPGCVLICCSKPKTDVAIDV